MKVANVQIQLNKKERPSTIAQVHFQCGVDIPKDVIIQAFERSWTDKKIIYVFLKVIKWDYKYTMSCWFQTNISKISRD